MKVYNPSKITKYGILVRMVCDSITGYTCGFKLYSGVVVPLKDTIMDLMAPHLYKWHILYMDNFYNCTKLAKDLFLKKVRICGIRTQVRSKTSGR